MTDIDLDRLGDVWRQQPDPAELERLRRSAAAVSRKARLAQIIDIGAALGVAAVVTVLVLSNPRPGTFLVGAAAILILLGSNIRLRKLRQVELRALTGSTEDMLDQSIDRVETTLKHNRFMLIGIGPAFLVGALVASRSLGNRFAELFPAYGEFQWLRILWLGLAIGVLAAGALYTAGAMRKSRRELGRLRGMREAYQQERASTD